MAFNAKYLSQLASNGPQLPALWVYSTLDAAAVVDSSAYFPSNVGLRLGDVVMRITHAGGTLEAPTGTPVGGFHIVSSLGPVDVSDVLAFTATDTD